MTSAPPLLYGLDIETDTSANGLDPSVAAVVAVAVSTADGDEVFTGDEADVLARLDAHLAALAPGTIVTWNGSGFDLPFLADRASLHQVELGLRILWDPTIAKRQPIAGHPGAYRARWHHHDHVDAYRAWRSLVDDGVSCGLKSVARVEGLEPVEVDAARVHELDAGTLARYVASDAWLARVLASRRWRHVARHRDRLDDSGQLALRFG